MARTAWAPPAPGSADTGQPRFVDAVSDTLKCPVCMDIFEDPVFCGGNPCQHIFCRVCVKQALEKTEHCPTCRGTMSATNLLSHQAISSLLDELLVCCDMDCGWIGRRDSFGSHVGECPLRRIKVLENELAQRDFRYNTIDRQLEERDARIAKLEERVVEQDKAHIEVGWQLMQREVHIAELETRLSQKQELLSQAVQQLVEKDAELVSFRMKSRYRDDLQPLISHRDSTMTRVSLDAAIQGTDLDM